MHKLKFFDEHVQLALKKETPIYELPTIPKYFAGQEILITGGSGFIGKVLIEKLLRSCPEIKTIFVLLRPKKGKSIQERIEKLFDVQLFDVLKSMNADFMKKLTPVAGDVAELGLALSPVDVEKMKNVSVIFHSAATVNFNDSIKTAIFTNTRGTREILNFAGGLPNLKSFVHVSTAYSNCHLKEIDEKIYSPLADWRKTIEICETLNENELDILTQHITTFTPNTYVFSKNLTEKVIEDYKEKIPLVVVRPSIVLPTVREPFPGWVDNLNGEFDLNLMLVLVEL